MSNSSPQDIYSITLNPSNEISLSGVDDNTVTIDLGSSYSTNMSTTYNFNPSIGTITITNPEQYEIDFGDTWVTHFPDFQEVEEMCKEYPALEKALENFKTIYEMVKDDYASKNKEES